MLGNSLMHKRNMYPIKKPLISQRLFVRVIGLEPTHREAPDPKSGVSTNFTTPAVDNRKTVIVSLLWVQIYN